MILTSRQATPGLTRGLISKLECGSNFSMNPLPSCFLVNFSCHACRCRCCPPSSLLLLLLPSLPFLQQPSPLLRASAGPYLQSPMSSALTGIASGSPNPRSRRRASSPSVSLRSSPHQRGTPAHCNLLLLPELHSHASGDLQVSSPTCNSSLMFFFTRRVAGAGVAVLQAARCRRRGRDTG